MKPKQNRQKIVFVGQSLVFSLVLLAAGYLFAQSKTIIDEWGSVQAPKPPELKPVTLDPKTSALLVLDLVKQTCNSERGRAV